MWKKTLGLVVLLFAFLTMGCVSSRRGYYRDGYAPVNVRVVRPAYRYYGPSYRAYHYNEHRHKNRRHDHHRYNDHDHH